MPRKTPTNMVDQLGHYDAKPIQYVKEYLASKAYEKWFMTPPSVYTTSEDIEIFYLDAKFDYDKAQANLAELRQNRNHQRKINKYRVKVAHRTIDELQNNFVSLNVFLRDSEEKKKLATEKINEEIEKHVELKNIVNTKKRIINELKSFRSEFKNTVEQYRPYEDVVNQACKRSGTYKSVNDMINRCDAIMVAQNEITILQDKLGAEIEQMTKRITVIIKHAELITSGLQNQLIRMERLYREACAKCKKWEKNFAKARSAVILNDISKIITIESVDSMYRMLCKRIGILPEFPRTNINGKLTFIEDEVGIMSDVLAEYNKRKKIAKTIKITPKC